MLGLDAHIDPLPVEAISYQNTTGLNVGYDADDGTGYGKGSLDLSSAKGVRYEPRTGDTTVFYKPGAIKLDGEVGSLFGPRVGGGGGTLESKNAELTGAYDFIPGQGFVPSRTCRKPGTGGSGGGGGGSW